MSDQEYKQVDDARMEKWRATLGQTHNTCQGLLKDNVTKIYMTCGLFGGRA